MEGASFSGPTCLLATDHFLLSASVGVLHAVHCTFQATNPVTADCFCNRSVFCHTVFKVRELQNMSPSGLINLIQCARIRNALPK